MVASQHQMSEVILMPLGYYARLRRSLKALHNQKSYLIFPGYSSRTRCGDKMQVAGLSLGFLYTSYTTHIIFPKQCIFLPCDWVLSFHIFPDQKTDWFNIYVMVSCFLFFGVSGFHIKTSSLFIIFWGIFHGFYLRRKDSVNLWYISSLALIL